MRRRPTIIDVAREAGVSKSTVSLVLQDSTAVRAETRTEVRRAMASIGYVYNRSAATLRSAKAGLIGLVINDLRNPFFTEFATSLQMALAARGYAAVIGNTNEDPALQVQVVSAMIEHGVSAVVISPAYGNDAMAFDQLLQAGIPAMQVLRKVEERADLFPFAAPDYALGSRLATEHLLSLGARRIAFVGGLAGRAVTQERMSGYLTCLSDRSIAPIAIPGRSSRSFGREVALSIARDWPDVDAALCFNDLVALGMQSGFAETGRTTGSDFRLVGFDDIEECAQAFPSLTSIRCNIAGFAQQIAATVLGWLEDGIQPSAEVRTPVELVVRNSTVQEIVLSAPV
jgi:LacI family transcriptional regulator